MSIKLNSGHSMPLVGFGCWQLDTKIAASQIYNAIKVGYRLFDLAADYGNDKQIGEGINKAIKDGLVKREELFITSKLWNTYHHPKNVGPALQKVLDDLQLDYIDLFLIHFPIALKFVPFEVKYPANLYKGDSDRLQFEDVTVAQTWGALEEEVKLGKTKSIGISNFNGALIFDLLKAAKIKPAVLQIEHHPYLQQPKLIEYVQSQDIAVTAYSSFGPQSYQAAEAHAPTLFEHKTIKSIGEKHKKTAAQVLLRWATQRSIAVIPKSNNPDRLKSNLEVNDFDLTKEEIDQISKLDIGFRFNDPWDWDEKSRIPIFV